VVVAISVREIGLPAPGAKARLDQATVNMRLDLSRILTPADPGRGGSRSKAIDPDQWSPDRR
jgi:hypothetical protein